MVNIAEDDKKINNMVIEDNVYYHASGDHHFRGKNTNFGRVLVFQRTRLFVISSQFLEDHILKVFPIQIYKGKTNSVPDNHVYRRYTLWSRVTQKPTVPNCL